MDLKNKNNLLSIYATTDYMTGFLNKRNGIEVLKNQLKILDENGKLSVFFIDINNLKLVNDMYGHKEGDELIITIGRILKQSLRKEDTVCRLGGDEFLVILPNCSFNQAEDVWRRICSNIYEYNQKKLKPYEISVSHGTHECKKGETVEQILFLADQKMYREKSVYKSLKLT
ncbi:diguanylate cyclase (GGDEF) domain-containing protein [Alkalithermobacter thermoalcaliphilus JW-YL-7 = DSM 7308]|uniref:Diguanylate cyclase n=1 Tax=Alkalithermobacter thermoalcaliphilus JW-YL-7 = DSM 7308 TaxID=1121328 RepID=A0A150FSE8_CLOPD|nr:diguanylate cyclase [[Clostridium] paradoxum JW-YL-7 = DSM 7308]SHK70953.1 diguanylate cyclase (GGDEF) domain-containing protein [[Clostridium] paradoxum JW-YL-7 = DSM 7308]